MNKYEKWEPIRVGEPNGIGFDGFEGMFALGSTVSEATMLNIPIDSYSAYNTSLTNASLFFDDFAAPSSF